MSLNYSVAQTSVILPLKKPLLTSLELNKKIIANINKPLKKPTKIKKEKKIIQKEVKLSFKIPKKKTNNKWI